jgi:hypothetical protein
MIDEHATVELRRQAVALPRSQRVTPAVSSTPDAGPEPPDGADLTPVEPRSLSAVSVSGASQTTDQPQSTSDQPIGESLITRILVGLTEGL